MIPHKPPTVHHATHGHIEHPTGHHGTHHVAHHERGKFHATGGPVEHPIHGAMGPKLPGGSGGGKGRLAKVAIASRHYPKPEGAHG